MNANQNSTRLVKTNSAKTSCGGAETGRPADRRAPWRSPRLPAKFWCRAVRIPVILFIAMLFVDIACAQIVLTNGANQAGTLLANTTNSYTLTANTGDSIVLRLGSSFNAKLQLKGPTGAFLGLAQDSPDNLIAYTATNSGTFTVLVSSFGAGGTGTYVLHLAQIPEAFIVPAGDEGGALTNGGNFAGTHNPG